MGNKPKPVFVTGATGSIGYMLAKRLSDNGSHVRVLVRDLSQAKTLKMLAGMEVLSGDLSRPKSLHGVLTGCSVVYHAAAKLLGSNRASFQAVNVDGTIALLDEAIRCRSRKSHPLDSRDKVESAHHRRDDCDAPSAWDSCRQPVQVAAPT
jgi:nucleoside-diphosphate-sugar epimerase